MNPKNVQLLSTLLVVKLGFQCISLKFGIVGLLTLTGRHAGFALLLLGRYAYSMLSFPNNQTHTLHQNIICLSKLLV